MKSKMILSLAMMTAALSLTACNAKEDENARLKEQVDRLEKQVQDLQDDPSQDISTSSENSPTQTPVTEDPPAGTPDPEKENIRHEEQSPQQNTSDVPDITALNARILDLEQRIKDTAPTGSAQEQREQFDLLQQEIASAEWDLDLLEDSLEDQYHNGTLDLDSYREDDQTIDVLEDTLDRCEDRLEMIFGIDD